MVEVRRSSRKNFQAQDARCGLQCKRVGEFLCKRNAEGAALRCPHTRPMPLRRSNMRRPPARLETGPMSLYLLGEEDRIIGVSGYVVRPSQVRREKLRVSAFTSADIPKILALDPDLILTSTIAADLISAGVAVHSSIPVPCTEPHFKERSRVKSSTTAQDTKVSAVGHHDPKDVERLLPSPICPSLIPMLAVGISCLGPGCLLLRNSKDEACPFHRPSPQRGRTLCKSGGRSDEMSAGIPMTSKSAPATARSWACWRHRAWARAGY